MPFIVSFNITDPSITAIPASTESNSKMCATSFMDRINVKNRSRILCEFCYKLYSKNNRSKHLKTKYCSMNRGTKS